MKNISYLDKQQDKTKKFIIKKEPHLYIDPLQSMQIISEVYTNQKYQKSFKPDEDRKQYINLIQWINKQFQIKNLTFQNQILTQKNCGQFQNLAQEKQKKQLQIILMAMNQFCILLKTQCREKGYLMQILLKYVYQLVQDYKKMLQNQITSVVNQYNSNLGDLQKQFQEKFQRYQQKLLNFQLQKETKWKNIYMLAKENRILRRQKGKLLRKIQEQQQTIHTLQHELLDVIKQNQVNKLVIKFQNDSQNLEIFMKNRVALMKFQKSIQKYPKKAMRALKDTLIKLQIQELNGLDNKINYIRKVINESGSLIDEYEDLNEMMKPNLMVFNMFTQTDFQQQKKFYQQFSQYGCQISQKQLILTINSYQIDEQIENLFLYNQKMSQSNQQKSKLDLFEFMKLKHPYKKNLKKTSGFLSLKRRACDLNSNYWNSKQNKLTYQAFRIIQCKDVIYNPNIQDECLKLSISEKFQSLKFKQTNKIFLKTQPFQKQSAIQQFFETLPQTAKNNRNKSNKKNKSLMAAQDKLLINQNTSRRSEMLSLNRIKQIWISKDKNGIGYQQNQSEIHNANTESLNNQKYSVQQPTKNNQNCQNNDQQFQQLRLNPRTVTQMSHRTKKNSRFARGSMINLKNTSNQNLNNQRNSLNIRQSLGGLVNSSKLSKNAANKNKIIKVLTESKQTERKFLINRTNSFLNNMQQMENIDETIQQNSDFQSQEKNQIQMQNEQKLQKKLKYNSKRMLSKILKTDSDFKQLFKQRSQNKVKTFNRNSVNVTQKSKFRNSAINQHTFFFQKQKNRNSSISTQQYSINSENTNNVTERFSIRKYAQQKQEQNQQILKKIQQGDWNIIQGITLKPFQIKKIVQKIIKSIYTRRKQLLNSNIYQEGQASGQLPIYSQPTLKSFIQSYLKQNYGNNWQGKNLSNYSFTFQDRSQSNTVKIFNILLNWHASREYLQDLFRLYIIMLQKNEYSMTNNSSFESYFICKKEKGIQIMKYLLSVYFDEKVYLQIMANLPFINMFQIDLNQVFLVVQNQIRKYSLETQLTQFLVNLLPESQSKITFSQIKQILFIFKFQQSKNNFNLHLARLKYFFSSNSQINQSSAKDKKQQKQAKFAKNRNKSEVKVQDQEVMPVHRISLYAKRYQWTQLLEINSYIQERYYKLIGVYIQQETLKYITKFISTSQDNLKANQNLIRSKLGFCQSINFQKITGQCKQTKIAAPFEFLLERCKEMIHNYYRYKVPLNRIFFMFIHVTLVQYRLQNNNKDVMSDFLQSINSQFKKLEVKKQIQDFIA